MSAPPPASVEPAALAVVEQDFADAVAAVEARFGAGAAQGLVARLAAAHGAPNHVGQPVGVTAYRNTIPPEAEPDYPGDAALEERLERLVRWNALAMVVRANADGAALGGHIATFASGATLFEVALNHHVRAGEQGSDLVYYQAHAAPGLYARALLEGRLSEAQAAAFRRQLAPGGGLSSYPHPRHMPEFWPAPTASMGLSTPMAIGQARCLRYLERRGLKAPVGERVWVFAGDGEMDEPEVVGSLALAARERLDNLVLVVNCNLQRLDGPVRGNGKVIQDLERSFAGAGWRVIKVVWGSAWDDLLARDATGKLQRRMDEVLDGQYQWYSTRSGAEQRAHWCGGDPDLEALMAGLSDEEIRAIPRGGHDRAKVHAAFALATRPDGRPTVVLAKTVKGYGLGAFGEGSNAAHQKKRLEPTELAALARAWELPLTEAEAAAAGFCVPAADDPVLEYLRARRAALGGPAPARRRAVEHVPALARPIGSALDEGSGAREQSTTMALTRLLAHCLRDPALGPRIVPIVADEARTFGMEGLFRQIGIHAATPQRYEPVDAGTMTAYVERPDGQLLQEGIAEAAALSSFTAAGTAAATWGVPLLPFYVYYSIFGLQRVGDLIWAAGDQLCRGFLVGATAGRTTLHGEGLQHQDGHTPLWAGTVPNLVHYDPAFGYELAAIVDDGLARLARGDDRIYYLTVYNESYPMPARPSHVATEDLLHGLYCYAPAAGRADVQLVASGPILREALRAREQLVAAGLEVAVWSATSWNELYREAVEVERAAVRHRARHSGEPGASHVARTLGAAGGVVVAGSDYVRATVDRLARFLPQPFAALGTDGWGLSDVRPALRRHFGVDAHAFVEAAVHLLESHDRLAPPAAARVRAVLDGGSRADGAAERGAA